MPVAPTVEDQFLKDLEALLPRLDRWVMTIMRSIWLNEQRAGDIRKRDAVLVAVHQGQARQANGFSGERTVLAGSPGLEARCAVSWQATLI